MSEFGEGEMAWDVLDAKTRRLLKEEIMAIYDSGEENISLDDIYKKLDERVPVDVIGVAVGELIDEGKVIEEEINPGEILAIVRQNRITLTRMERKVDIIAEGTAKLMKMLTEIKEIVHEDYDVDIDIKEYITSMKGIAPKQEVDTDDGKETTIETEDSGDGED